jgi:2-dehydro-3-deoxyphosphogluconate aldolase / (4S)-4-hydroxy-2-oxoglutarate aldolase
MNKGQTLRRIAEIGVVPVVRVRSTDLAYRAADALLEGGIAIFEITLTIPNAIAVVRSLAARLGDRALIGAGTVVSPADVDPCVDAGARFIVSPGLDPAVVDAAHRHGVLAVPGALTPTEVMAALRTGVEIVKIFPCSSMGGAKYIRALRGPLPHVQLLPTGGVTVANAAEYIEAGATAVGMSELVDEKMLEAGQGAALADRARDVAVSVRAARRARGPAAS